MLRRFGIVLALGALAAAPPATDPRVATEIAALRAELARLTGQERSVLGEIAKLDAELALRDAELRDVGARFRGLTDSIQAQDQDLQALDSAQRERQRWLAFRLREVYKGGLAQPLEKLLSGDEPEVYWRGMGYTAVLSARDARVLSTWRVQALSSTHKRGELAEARAQLTEVERELSSARAALAASRGRRAAALQAIRSDQGRRRAALAELERAGRELSNLTGSLSAEAGASAIEANALRGSLDWPAEGRVTSGFGSVTNTRFKTAVPHPGWDFEAPAGADIRCVADGTVAFSDWMRGYGQTVIVDHGGGLLSVYAHAAALGVARGARVSRGQVLGQVGDTGSLRGPFLYFELRLAGKPVDPVDWLRRR